ncbi:MAG TPA: hypothetical protein VFV94_00610 [Polyangiaceae bacterium]|jgi:hypothetical protein|nr:hypothetical protein [Polyangiaceae bacterium]
MLRNQRVRAIVLVLASAATFACASDRDVEVTGSVAAPVGQTVSGPITLSFLDVISTDETPKSVAEAKLDAVGEFKQTVTVEGDTVRVRAVVDTDGNGACSAGELWAESDAAIQDDDSVAPVTLTLGTAPCPAAM